MDHPDQARTPDAPCSPNPRRQIAPALSPSLRLLPKNGPPRRFITPVLALGLAGATPHWMCCAADQTRRMSIPGAHGSGVKRLLSISRPEAIKMIQIARQRYRGV